MTQNIDNPFNPNEPVYTPETKTLAQVTKKLIRNALLSCRVCVPCVITEVLGNQKVQVQPLIQALYVGGVNQTLPVLNNVPVGMPRGNDWFVKFPIAPGDIGYCLFSDRSLDIYLNSPGNVPVAPNDARIHDLADPIFIPEPLAYSTQTQDETTDMVLANGLEAGAQLRIKKSGMFAIQNEITELLSQIKLLVDTLSTASTVAGGPFTPDVVAILESISEQLVTLGG